VTCANVITLTALEDFLNKVAKHVSPPKERTLFSLGARGYYENPASDILAYFLKPDAEHGLKGLFLSVFFECIGVDHRQFDMSYVDVQREVETANGNYIDLQILGRDWCLLIENKIYHIQSNPFKDYEAHAGLFQKKARLFSILSPDGHSEADGWIGVSYNNYCLALRGKMAEKFFDAPFSKWQLFAREFILHIENELNNPHMKPDQADFVEQHADQFAMVQELAKEYIEFICEELKRQLETTVPGCVFNVKVEWWGFRCSTPQWGRSDIVLLRVKDFKIRAYLYFEDISESHPSSAMAALMFGPTGSGSSYRMWDSVVGFDSRNKAIAELCKCAKVVNNLMKTKSSL